MTEEVSGIETDNEPKKKDHLVALQAAAKLTDDEIRDRVEVVELVHLASRSELVSVEFKFLFA